MGRSEYGDLRINGSGIASGGKYNGVRINGSGKITSDIICNEFSLNGSGAVEGSAEASKVSINGSGTISGEVKAEEIKVSGSAVFKGNVTGENIHVSGSSETRGNLSASKVRIDGSVQISGDCSAEEFRSNGVFNIGGLLNADEIDIKLHWHRSSAREIGGSRIDVKLDSAPRLFMSLITGQTPVLEAELIEGDEISLENTKAKVVRGNKITIGKGCEIGTVEYKDFCRRDSDSKIGSEQKM